MSGQEQDRKGADISVGDTVYTKIRGGSHEGKVEKVIKTQEEAAAEGVKNPPKVLYHDQHGHKVAHNPGTLEVLGKDGK